MTKHVNPEIIQYVAIMGSLILIVSILLLIRNKKIKEKYSLLWLFFGIIFLLLSIWRDSLEIIARMLGIAYAPAALFLVLIIAIISILIHFSVIITRLEDYVTNLVQEIGLLKMEIEDMKKGSGSSASIKESE
jgi:hypothetical protein